MDPYLTFWLGQGSPRHCCHNGAFASTRETDHHKGNRVRLFFVDVAFHFSQDVIASE